MGGTAGRKIAPKGGLRRRIFQPIISNERGFPSLKSPSRVPAPPAKGVFLRRLVFSDPANRSVWMCPRPSAAGTDFFQRPDKRPTTLPPGTVPIVSRETWLIRRKLGEYE